MSYRKIDKNKYKLEIEFTKDGKRYRKSKTITTTKKGPQLKSLLAFEESELYKELELDAGDKGKLSQMTFEQFAKWHIKTLDIEQHTIDSYNNYLKNRTYEYFKNKKIVNISESYVEKFFKSLDQEISKTTNKPLSQKTKKNYLVYLQAIFNRAIKEEIITKNPCKNITIKVPRRTLNKKYYGPEELKYIIEKVQIHAPTVYQLMFMLTVVTGMRPAELLGLKWKKINLETKEILIDTSLTLTKGKGYIYKSTKTEDSRTLFLTDYLIDLLKVHLSDEKLKRKQLKITKDIQDCYVFTNDNYNHKGSTVFGEWYERFCKKYDLRYIPQYGLRHTAGTLLAYNNIPIISVAEQLGHKNLSTTEIYVHAVDEMKYEIKNVMEDVTTPKLRLIKTI